MNPTLSTSARPADGRSGPAVVAAIIALGCGAKSVGSPDAASPESASGDRASAHVVAAATSTAPPAEPRALPSFCNGTGEVAPPPGYNVHLTHVKDGFVFVEGPAWSDAVGAFFFSEMDFEHPRKNGPPSTIYRLVLPSSIEVFIPDSGSNGLAIDDEGLVACTHDTQTLSRFDLASKARTVFAADYQGKHFNSPNDVALHSAGYAYFTDPDWQIGDRENETGVTGVYLRQPSGEVVLLDGGVDKPNGITLSPDETRLYVSAVSGVVHVYPVLADGGVGPRKTFAQVKEPDGMAVDCAGRLYVASTRGEVVVLSPEGQAISIFKVAPRVTNVAFGGPDHRTLLVTAGSGLYSLHSNTPGFPY